MKEYVFNELVYFTEKQINNAKETMEGRTFMNFHIKSGNQCGNHTLIICTDYEDSEEKIKSFFLNCALSSL